MTEEEMAARIAALEQELRERPTRSQMRLAVRALMRAMDLPEAAVAESPLGCAIKHANEVARLRADVQRSIAHMEPAASNVCQACGGSGAVGPVNCDECGSTGRAHLANPQPAPRYDDLFALGKAWLDNLASEPEEPREAPKAEEPKRVRGCPYCAGARDRFNDMPEMIDGSWSHALKGGGVPAFCERPAPQPGPEAGR